MSQLLILCLHKICNEIKQWIINKTITITSINIPFLLNSGKLGSPRSLSASPRYRVSFTSVTDQLYSLSRKSVYGAPKEVFTSIIQCVWFILSRKFSSSPAGRKLRVWRQASRAGGGVVTEVNWLKLRYILPGADLEIFDRGGRWSTPWGYIRIQVIRK